MSSIKENKSNSQIYSNKAVSSEFLTAFAPGKSNESRLDELHKLFRTAVIIGATARAHSKMDIAELG